MDIEVIDYSNIQPYNEDPDYINIRICLEYPESDQIVNYVTNMDKFDIELHYDGGYTTCKPHKAESYYKMLKYYVESDFTPLEILNGTKICKEI